MPLKFSAQNFNGHYNTQTGKINTYPPLRAEYILAKWYVYYTHTIYSYICTSYRDMSKIR